jgi:hypothetical protein
MEDIMKMRQLSSSAVFRGPFSKTQGFPSTQDMEQVADRISVLAVGGQVMLSFWCPATGGTSHYCLVLHANDHQSIIAAVGETIDNISP